MQGDTLLVPLLNSEQDVGGDVRDLRGGTAHDAADRDRLLVATDFGPGSLTDSGYPRVIREWRRGAPLADALVWEKGHRYGYRLRPSTYMQAAMLVEEAAKLPAKRWATIAPNYEYGQSAVASFKELLKAKTISEDEDRRGGRPGQGGTPIPEIDQLMKRGQEQLQQVLAVFRREPAKRACFNGAQGVVVKSEMQG